MNLYELDLKVKNLCKDCKHNEKGETVDYCINPDFNSEIEMNKNIVFSFVQYGQKIEIQVKCDKKEM